MGVRVGADICVNIAVQVTVDDKLIDTEGDAAGWGVEEGSVSAEVEVEVLEGAVGIEMEVDSLGAAVVDRKPTGSSPLPRTAPAG